MFSIICFALFAAICLASGIALLLSKHPINGAMALVLNMLSLAGIYTLLQSTFLGVLQILVYAGAVMMLIVFVIMVLNGARETKLPRIDKLGLYIIFIAMSGALLLVSALYSSDFQSSEAAMAGTVAVISKNLFDTGARSGELTGIGGGYFILFEIIGLILLSAMVSAVLLAKRKLSPNEN